MKVLSPATLAQRPSGGTLPPTVIFKTRVLCSHYLPPLRSETMTWPMTGYPGLRGSSLGGGVGVKLSFHNVKISSILVFILVVLLADGRINMKEDEHLKCSL